MRAVVYVLMHTYGRTERQMENSKYGQADRLSNSTIRFYTNRKIL